MKPMMIQLGDQMVPHWVLRPETEWDYFESFERFLELTWEALGLPEPTRAQRQMAHRLQYGIDKAEMAAGGEPVYEGREDIIRAFRGIGKSFITAAFVLWCLMRNPRDEKVLVISASGGKAEEFVAMAKNLLHRMPILAFLIPRDDQRNKAMKFDVNGASIAQSYSVKAAGITGQIVGSRATLIIADDIEVVENSKTEEARERLMRSTSEFEAIKMPGAIVIYLGTPQTEESIYNRLVKERQYSCFCIPARYPRADKLDGYILKTDDGIEINILAYFLREMFENLEIAHYQPTDPERFGELELVKREAKGRSFFALQYQLDTTLSDAERYPLRQHDLIVFECNTLKGPLTVQWGRHSDRKNVINDISNLGFTGDHLLRPLFVDEEWRPFEGSVLFVDPSGRGKDETSWSIVKSLNGLLYLVHQGAEVADPALAMEMIAKDAKAHNVNVIEVEPNFGQGMWVTAFQPILSRVWPGGCTVQESEWAKGQKETRIIDTLEPVLTQHRLVVNESLLRKDAKTENRNYSLLYQLTHITRDRGALTHDDRLDSLAGAVAYFMRLMATDVDEAKKAMLADEMEMEIEDFIESFEFGGLGNTRKALRSNRRGPDGEREMVYRTTVYSS
jgi:hypothetical protein